MSKLHPVVAGYLKEFSEQHDILSYEESDRFERFINYLVLSIFYPDDFDIESVTTSIADDGIDGAAVLIEGDVYTTKEDVEAKLKNTAKNSDKEIKYVFIQSKRSAKFDIGELAKFINGVKRIIVDNSYIPSDSILKDIREINDVILNNIGKIRGGRPVCECYYVTTGKCDNNNFATAIRENCQQLKNSGYFRDVKITLVGQEKIFEFWDKASGKNTSEFSVVKSVPFPGISGVKESYLTIVNAKEFINSIVLDEYKRIRYSIFDDNVRSYLGDENPVNAAIISTIQSREDSEKFAVLNNGITMVASDVRQAGDRFYVHDFQIVNGCQTSHALARNVDRMYDNVTLSLKIVSSEDNSVLSSIVEATNTQTPVQSGQFLSLRPYVKTVERFFNYYGAEEGARLYFERRTNQFGGEYVSKTRIFDIKGLSRAYSAMFLDVPHTALRYPKEIMEQMSGKIFQNGQKEKGYYISALILYRLLIAFSNRHIESNYRIYRYHILMLICYIYSDINKGDLKSRKFENECDKLYRMFKKGGKDSLAPFFDAIDVIDSCGLTSRDTLKGRAYTQKLIEKVMRN